ncbi:LPS assembly lipoprotein LptE [Orrella sp. JC864]|uniref:LPS-assembly lipoprotein LptE n=1 Tax=Orrella sp. JC864 TaxID=3120298 RepID=UPI0030082FA5
MVRSLSLSALLPRLAGVALLAMLAGCGFALRGAQPMPLETLYIGTPDNTRFGADLRRALQASSPNTRLVATPKEAQASFVEVARSRGERDVSLNPDGRVEEYELTVRYVFRLVDDRGRVILPDTTLTAVRDMPYDDQVLQAKQQEAQTLFEDMERSLVARIVRRLTAPDVTLAIENLRANPDAETLGPAVAAPAPQTGPDRPAAPDQPPTLGSRPSRY